MGDDVRGAFCRQSRLTFTQRAWSGVRWRKRWRMRASERESEREREMCDLAIQAVLITSLGHTSLCNNRSESLSPIKNVFVRRLLNLCLFLPRC